MKREIKQNSLDLIPDDIWKLSQWFLEPQEIVRQARTNKHFAQQVEEFLTKTVPQTCERKTLHCHIPTILESENRLCISYCLKECSSFFMNLCQWLDSLVTKIGWIVLPDTEQKWKARINSYSIYFTPDVHIAIGRFEDEIDTHMYYPQQKRNWPGDTKWITKDPNFPFHYSEISKAVTNFCQVLRSYGEMTDVMHVKFVASETTYPWTVPVGTPLKFQIGNDILPTQYGYREPTTNFLNFGWDIPLFHPLRRRWSREDNWSRHWSPTTHHERNQKVKAADLAKKLSILKQSLYHESLEEHAGPESETELESFT